MKKTILLMFSGGVDSTFMLHHYLTKTDYNIHVHHISFRNPCEPRWLEEDTASRKIVEYCRRIRPFAYSESRFDFGFSHYVGRDSDTQLLTAAKVAPNLEGIVQVVLGWQQGDHSSGEERVRRLSIAKKLWMSLCEGIDAPFGERVSRELLFPLIDMELSKKEMIALLPRDLLRLTWSCRRPVRDGAGVSRSCGKCTPCREITQAIGGGV